MAEIKFCEYNYDTGAIDVIFADGQKLAVLCNRIEDTLDLTSAMRSKFDWLIFNEPETFVTLSLSGELEDYLKQYAQSYGEQESSI